MKKYKYPRIQRRLFIGLISLIAIILITNILHYKDIKKINFVSDKIIEHPYVVSNAVRDIHIGITAMQRAMKDIVLSENERELNDLIRTINNYEEEILENFTTVEEKFLGDKKQFIDARNTFINSKPIREEVIALVNNGNYEAATFVLKSKGNDHITLLFDKTRRMIDFANHKANEFNQSSLEIVSKAKQTVFLLSIVSTLLGFALFIWIYSGVSQPINSIIKRIKKVLNTKDADFEVLKSTNNSIGILDIAISQLEHKDQELEKSVKARTNELYEAKKIMENAIDHSFVGMVMINYQGFFTKVNKAFCDYAGYSQKELLNMKFTDLTVSEEEDNVSAYITRVFSGEKLTDPLEKRCKHKTGKINTGQLSMSLIEGGEGFKKYIFVQVFDITKQRAFELELDKYKKGLEKTISNRTIELDEKAIKLEKSQKALTFLLEDVNDIRAQLAISNNKLLSANEELESFSYSVSHDLKAPLRAVIGFSQIIMEDYGKNLDTEVIRYFNLIRNSAENMAVLINDLLHFSRLTRKGIRFSTVNLNNIIERIQNELTLNDDSSIEWIVQTLPRINADETLMYQVMLNLISNAIKFTEKDNRPKIEIGYFLENDKNVFYVKDNGIGIKADYFKKIFDVFQRLHTTKDYEGTGIGLAIVSKAISKQDGKIWLESELNKGTTFYFYI